MPEETAAATSEAVGSLADILGQPETLGAQDTTPEAGVSEATGATETDVAVAEPPEEGQEAPPTDESELAPTEAETDYSDEVYQRFAQHFNKQFKLTPDQQLNPENPLHRQLLREIIQRGEDFRRLQAQAVTEPVPEQPAEEAEPEPAPQPETPEQVMQFMQSVDRFAESRVRPEVAKVFLGDFLTALWGDKGQKLAASASPEAAKQFTKGMMKFGYLFLNDALPEILQQYVPQLLGTSYPGFERVTQDAVFEAALENVSAAVDPNGEPLYPELDELLDNESFDAVYQANPWLRDHRFADRNGRLLHPVEQEQRRLEMAIALARGQRPPAEMLQQAVETGRQQVRRQQQQAGAGRLAPGESSGGFEQAGDEADKVLKGMAQFGDRDRQIQDLLAPRAKP